MQTNPVTQPMSDSDKMPFGTEHRGKCMDAVPDGYLVWAYSQYWLKSKYPHVYDYIVRNAKTLPDLILRPEDMPHA